MRTKEKGPHICQGPAMCLPISGYTLKYQSGADGSQPAAWGPAECGPSIPQSFQFSQKTRNPDYHVLSPDLFFFLNCGEMHIKLTILTILKCIVQ